MVSDVRCKEDPCGHILIRGKAMAGRAKHLFQLVNCVLQEVQFTDQQRFKQLVFEFKARMQNLLGGSGHKIRASRMEAKLNVSGGMAEQMFGIRLEWNFQATCLLDLFCIS
ncbi:hypothetical protein TB2_034169 [Malus domestica]